MYARTTYGEQYRSRSSAELRAPFAVDILLLTLTLLLVGFGVLILYSTTGILSQEQFGDGLHYVRKQAVAALIGIVCMLVATRIPARFLLRVSPYCFPLAVLLLVLPLIPGLGVDAGGASRWITFGGVRFQPGEMVKLLLVLFMAGYFYRQEHKLERFVTGVVVPLGMVGFFAVLYLLQPDFGSTALVVGITLIMAFCAGVKLSHLFASGMVALSALGTMVFVSPYRMKRIMSFLNPELDASGQGYQLIQSLIAIGSGELTGVGLGASQQKLFFLPAAHTDFIYAVVAEELGFVGSISLLVLYLVFLWRGLVIARRFQNESFRFTLSIGLTLLIVAPSLLNIGVVTGLLPTKGLVLPLISYGGTSLITCLIVVGLLLSLSRSQGETLPDS